MTRCAMTLVEVMVVGTLLTIVAGVAISLLATVKKWDNRLRDHGLRTEQVLRIAESIRTDIRRSENALLPTADTLLLNLAGGGQVRYELQPDGCRRTAQYGQDGSPTTDRFAIGAASIWKLDRIESGRRSLIVVELQRPAADGEAEIDRVPLVVYGALGADHPRPPDTTARK